MIDDYAYDLIRLLWLTIDDFYIGPPRFDRPNKLWFLTLCNKTVFFSLFFHHYFIFSKLFQAGIRTINNPCNSCDCGVTVKQKSETCNICYNHYYYNSRHASIWTT